jgi:hypothetical protein
LAGVSIILLIATQAKVAALIPMYAIGVFTGFTMAGVGMCKHHWTHRSSHWRLQAAISGFAAVVCIVVVIVFAVTEFLNGAWVVVVVMPALVYALVRTNRQYRAEDTVLEEGAAVAACEARILRRHVVVILVDRIDLAAARAIQYARTLMPDDLRAVHFNIDEARAQNLMERWQRVGLSQLPLDVIDCPDRRLGRAALELAAELADGETEVSMLLPRRSYGKALRRILHDQTADYIVDFVSQLSHVNATIVPFLVAPGIEPYEAALIAAVAPQHTGEKAVAPAAPSFPVMPLPTIDGVTPIAALQWRRHAKISGRVKTLRVQPWSGVSTLECVIVDNSGEALTLVFLGRRSIPGIRSGTLMTVESTVGKHHGQLAMINPLYEILSTSEPIERR